MASRIVMSKLSPTMEEGRVLKWVKQEGESVDSGDVVVEIETDKATMEVEAMGSGVLRKVLVEENATVPTGTLLGVIAAEDEDISSILQEAAPAAAATTAPATESGARAALPDQPASPARAGDGGRIKASPLARRMASQSGIRLDQVRGSGPGGRIIKRDIEAAMGAGLAAPTAAPATPAPEIEYDIPYQRVELSQLRKAIARNLVQSLGPIPHFFLTREIDMGEVLKLRAELNDALLESGVRIGVNDILVKTAAQALTEHPDVNAAFAGDHIRRFTRVDIGIAVAVPDGLITPVLRDVAHMRLREISEASREMIARARDRKLAPEEYQGATFTISNLGMYGVDEFTAVINPPAATILAVGATQERPVVVDGAVEIRPRMRVTLSCDHRAVDGAMGAEFLATFAAMLENPLRQLL
ncbi:MAG: 2-oxo acid dehydrogenase subunit E2 [Gemmatimonadota bacterium]|nr:MAG: 2-oxo acid dehydrogenase subunit E2 [Gemmatimonadota bacterium]